jgi:hypothetical protein
VAPPSRDAGGTANGIEVGKEDRFARADGAERFGGGGVRGWVEPAFAAVLDDAGECPPLDGVGVDYKDAKRPGRRAYCCHELERPRSVGRD